MDVIIPNHEDFTAKLQESKPIIFVQNSFLFCRLTDCLGFYYFMPLGSQANINSQTSI